jgi:hypothetical protein
VEAETGVEARTFTTGGTSDARFLRAVCPVIEFGLCNATMHKRDEAVAIPDLAAAGPHLCPHCRRRAGSGANGRIAPARRTGEIMDRKLTLYILAGMVLGVIVGQVLNQMVPADVIKADIAPWFKLLSDIFLNLIKMLVAPLVLSTIVVGIAHMGDSAALGRIGVRALTWFITASLVSIGLGLILVNLFQPGVGAPIPDVAEPPLPWAR